MHGIPRAEDLRIVSGIIVVIRNCLCCCNALFRYRPHKAIDNGSIRKTRLGVFKRIFEALAAKGGQSDQLMIDATHLKAHRTVASLLNSGMCPAVSVAPEVV